MLQEFGRDLTGTLLGQYPCEVPLKCLCISHIFRVFIGSAYNLLTKNRLLEKTILLLFTGMLNAVLKEPLFPKNKHLLSFKSEKG
jgi:hypothetical protein